ncbi:MULTISPECIES: isochorismatase family protein [Clostridia]|uniref:isochorismatase family protein n=1 Tax=Clostridia TaxID=186801 RepID=UPI0018F33A65|nr:isochorismatase family protein [Clostridium sp. 1xD42-85]
MDGSEQESAVYNQYERIKNINLVIDKSIQVRVPVVFARDLDVAKGSGQGFDVHDQIHVPKGSHFFDKRATNAFHGTNLLQYLKNQKTEHVVIMGCQTQHCIDSTVRTATINGLDVTLVGDGHSTTDNEVLSAKQIIDHHNKTLHGHYNVEHFSIVRNAEEDLFQPTHDLYR